MSQHKPPSVEEQPPKTGTVSRRSFLSQIGAAGVAATTAPLLAHAEPALQAPSSTHTTDALESAIPTTLRVNGKSFALSLDPRTSLLDALRETMDLTGTKKGCDHGQCGACTVHVNGRRINSCLKLAAMH